MIPVAIFAVIILIGAPVFAGWTSWKMSGLSVKAWLLASLIGDDPYDEDTGLDHIDKTGRRRD